MESKSDEGSKDPRTALVEKLLGVGNLAFDPSSSQASRASAEAQFNDIIHETGTLTLIPVLNILIHPGRVPPWLHAQFLRILSSIPLRKDGVRGTLEFVFSVHPSSTVSNNEAATPQTKGANITHEALSMATRLLCNPPTGTSPYTWFSGIANQLLGLLDGRDGFELIKVASYVIGFGILGRKQYGAPGTAGWKCFAEPMLTTINPSLSAGDFRLAAQEKEEAKTVINLSKRLVVASTADLATGLNRLQALLISHPNPGLSRRLINPILLPLWALSSWPGEEDYKFEQSYGLPARNLLSIYLKISSSPEKLNVLAQNLLYRGEDGAGKNVWLFERTESGDVQIVTLRGGAQAAGDLPPLNLEEIPRKTDSLVDLIESVFHDGVEIAEVFSGLFNSWTLSRSRADPHRVVLQEDTHADDPLTHLFETSVLQKMMEKFSENLIMHPSKIIELVGRVIDDAVKSRDEEIVTVSLSLLNLVFTTPNFRRGHVDQTSLHAIETSLETIARLFEGNISDTARNLSLFIKYRDELEEPSENADQPSDKLTEDRKTHSLALSYITQADAPAPVRAEGLNLLQSLIISDSPILDIQATLVLMSSILEDSDDYINLRVIKIFTQLANRHPKTVTKELVDRYVDPSEKASIDSRLRFGEALLQVTERLGETFAGDTARQVVEALLVTAGRRGHRPKTAMKKERADRLQHIKNEKAKSEWAGEVPALGDEIPEDELEKNEILRSIVEGWEGKGGAEDVRIRASALSVLAVGIETNIGGIGSDFISAAVDLCINVLTLEQDDEKAILRRAAILFVLAFIRALAKAREQRRALGFGLTDQSREDILRVLRYVAVTDNDGLVRQHAADVIESLENWRMTELLPASGSTSNMLNPPGLSQLAGLDLNPDAARSTQSNSKLRPRIEEIE